MIMPTIYIDDKPYEVPEGKNLLHACLSLGFDIPYYCWHPVLHSVGACRQCAVKMFKDEEDKKGRIVMSCMTPAKDGTRISIDDPDAKEFRKSVAELLMINHPHDCPVCDEGGECHLQDMTLMSGHTYRRHRFEKRTFRNQYLGPFINHEMNRCIACYRCVRFYAHYAKGRDLDVFRWHDEVYFGRAADGPLESEFSGNLVEVCPTGVFTDKTLKKHYTRKWDRQTAPSVCVHCSLGCNTIPAERYGTLRMIRNRYNHEINGYFLCDRGRFGYEFVNSERRIRNAYIQNRPHHERHPLLAREALDHAAQWLHQAKGVIGIGSPRASLEANYLLRSLVGPGYFYSGMSIKDHSLTNLAVEILRTTPARILSLADVQKADAVLILGEDVTRVAPMLTLSLLQTMPDEKRQSVHDLHIEPWDAAAVREVIQEDRKPIYVITPAETRLDHVAMKTLRAAPDNIARLGFAIAHRLDPKAPAVDGLNGEETAWVQTMVEALKNARRPLVVSGTTCGSEDILKASANVVMALCNQGGQASICLSVRECNSLGAGMLEGGDLAAAYKMIANGKADSIIILENDLFMRASRPLIRLMLETAKQVLVLDHLENHTTALADLVLPAATYAESEGTLVNNEGRAQRFFTVYQPVDDIQESWRWLFQLRCLLRKIECPTEKSFDEVISEMAESIPALQPVLDAAPQAPYRIVDQKIPRQPHRYSGRTAMWANLNVQEPEIPVDHDSPLIFSMEGSGRQPPPALIPRFWKPRWNSPQAVDKYQTEVGGPLRGDRVGRRLWEAAPTDSTSYYMDVPPVFRPKSGKWLMIPTYQIFGSEELSRWSPAVMKMAPAPALGLNAEDMERLGIGSGDWVEIIGDVSVRLRVVLQEKLPVGVAAWPEGLVVPCCNALPAWVELLRSSEPTEILKDHQP
jgi:NADH-quinone oxidoreductase subunit G